MSWDIVDDGVFLDVEDVDGVKELLTSCGRILLMTEYSSKLFWIIAMNSPYLYHAYEGHKESQERNWDILPLNM